MMVHSRLPPSGKERCLLDLFAFHDQSERFVQDDKAKVNESCALEQCSHPVLIKAVMRNRVTHGLHVVAANGS